jgi:uncharacterized repeat protein (TIGR03803 family)
MPKTKRRRPSTRLLWLACGFAVLANLPPRAQAQPTERVLHNFGTLPPGTTGANPYAGVILGADGNLYGTTVNGGSAKLGVVYQVNAKGRETVLHSFTNRNGDGANPYAGVIRDANGNLYGTTANGGDYLGVVYELDAAGNETILHTFTGGADGANPSSGVVRDAAGNLYGVTSHGGTANVGVVYKIDATGLETVLYSFTGGADGAGPNSLIRDDAGSLYGTTASGGAGKSGVVFKLDAAGQESVLYYFAGLSDGAAPVGVTRDAAGNFYGATASGGLANAGTVFKIDAAGPEKILYSFAGGVDGKTPAAGVVRDAAGNLYGATVAGGSGWGVVYKVDPQGQETVRYSFSGGTDGSTPESGVTLDAAGDIYGTTSLPGSGAVYKIHTAGQETVVSNFMPTTVPDGADPQSGVILDAAGNLYGTSSNGGPAGFGTVYKLETKGREVLVHAFTGGADGAYPYAGVTLDTAGNLYGTTTEGGSAGKGVVYEVDAAGHETVLYAFTGGNDGGEPYAGVALDDGGNLYGTATVGGQFGHGAVYKLDAAGQETVVHSFGGGFYGDYPLAGVIRDAAGNLYGTTYAGGVANAGILYKVDTGGGFTVLYSFTGLYDGANPYAGVIRNADGNLYGTANGGGVSGGGVVYELDTAGNYSVLYSFCAQAYCTDGAGPTSLIRDSGGIFYGTTVSGGKGDSFDSGVVYVLDAAGHENVLHAFTGGDDGYSPNGVIRSPAGNLFGSTAFGGKKSEGVVFEIVLP